MKKSKNISTSESLKDNVQNGEIENGEVPKEVVDMLIETHPLRSSAENFDEEKHFTRYTNLNDKDFSKKVRQAEEEYYNNSPQENTNDNINLNNPSPQKQTNEPKTSKSKQRKKKGSAINVSDISKQADLDAFFEQKVQDISDDGDDLIINIIKRYVNIHNPKHKKIIIGSIISFCCIFIILLVSTIFLAGSLAKSNAKISQSLEIEDQNSELKLKINQLDEEIAKLGGNPSEKPKNADETQGADKPSGEEKEQEANNDLNMDTYTVVDGDTFWDISKKVYGNGANYQKILDANNMTENDRIKAGLVLKIPKI